MRKKSPLGNALQPLLTGQVLRKHTFIGGILLVALLAFEVFNFDTTKFALNSVLGDVKFAGVQWAAILAIAFCAIDFAGLARLFTPERGRDEPKEVWYLMGAWILGATMNAVMTWWAVTLTVISRPYGNSVLSHEQLIIYVPIFVAVLVWLTRILFIGSLTVAGEHIIWGEQSRSRSSRRSNNTSRGKTRPAPKPRGQYQPRAPQAAMSAAEAAEAGEVRPQPSQRVQPGRVNRPVNTRRPVMPRTAAPTQTAQPAPPANAPRPQRVNANRPPRFANNSSPNNRSGGMRAPGTGRAAAD